VHAEEEDLLAADHDVGFLDVRATCADRLDLPAFEDDAGFVLLLDEVVVEGLAVFDDAHGSASRGGAALSRRIRMR